MQPLSWLLFSAGVGLTVMATICTALVTGASLVDPHTNTAESVKRLKETRPLIAWAVKFVTMFGVALAAFGLLYPFLVYAFG